MEEPELPAGDFGRTEQQEAGRAQREEEVAEDMVLHAGTQIDQQVAAAHEVELMERWIEAEIVDRKCHQIPEQGTYLEPVRSQRSEETIEALLGDALGDPGRIDATSGQRDRGGLEV